MDASANCGPNHQLADNGRIDGVVSPTEAFKPCNGDCPDANKEAAAAAAPKARSPDDNNGRLPPPPLEAVPNTSMIASLKHPNDNPIVDWRGRPWPKDRKPRAFRSSLCILGAIVCGYFAFGGVFFNLVLYLKRVWHQGDASAANDVTNLVGTIYVTCLLGAFLGDAYLGRMLTVALFLIIYMIGCVLSSMAVTMQESVNTNKQLPLYLKSFLTGSLFLTAIGCGSYQPVIVSLGGDQFDDPKDKARFFSWVFVASNIGVMLSLTILTYLENIGKWALGFWISTAAIAVTVPLFLMGVPTWRQMKPGGNPLIRILQVFVSAMRKMNMKASRRSLYEVEGEHSIIRGSRKIAHTTSFGWLDKATFISEREIKEGNGLIVANPWRLCTITQVEEVKCVLRIIPVALVGILYNVANAQLVSFFVIQGETMDASLGKFKVPPGSMRLFTNIAGILFPPLYEYFLVPRLRQWTHHAKGLKPLQRMGCGLIIATLGMIMAAILEMKRLHISHRLSIVWLIPQFTILGISNTFFIVAQMDFFYTEISDSMRSMGSSLFLLCMGLGSYMSTLLVIIVTSISSHHSSINNWIPHNINFGHLDYFYWLLAILLFTTLIFLYLHASTYTYLQINSPSKQKTSLDSESPSQSLDTMSPDVEF